MSLDFVSSCEQQCTAPSMVNGANAVAVTAESELRRCRPSDLVRVAEIHKAQFGTPGALLGHLSAAFIACFYSGFIGGPIFMVHATDAIVDGFVLGGARRELIGCKFAGLQARPLICLMDIIRRPNLWWRATRPLAKLVGSHLWPATDVSRREQYRLLSIAVAPDATNRGIGTALVRGFEEAIRKVSATYDLDVLKTNAAAHRFYEKLGFEYVGGTAGSWTLRKTLAK